MDVTLLLEQAINGLSLGSLYALIAVGYTVVYGIVQLINFAHGEIFMMGAFGSLTVYLLVGSPTHLTAGMALGVLFPGMIAGGVALATGTALLTERFAYRPLRGAPRLAPLISAIGISVFLQEFIRLFYGRIPGFPDSKRAIPFPHIEGITGNTIQLGSVAVKASSVFTVVALAVCTAFLWYYINKTQTGRAMVATAQDPDMARLMGINVDVVIMRAFAVGAGLAAVAGVAQGLYIGNIDFKMGFMAGLKAFTAAVLGGIGNINGALVGGLVLGVVEAFAAQLGPTAWKDVWAFVILILVLVFRPRGLLGARVVDRA
ncbi:MAG: branched-chain amino acid ABC transporter permease [Bifidobacteriaceae bacterium]|jgi:branched-chain amino acid transport system permease protein|nr:branched-chain amino acid ABC transporter permease [Bifidobacteriaceae bacterium]